MTVINRRVVPTEAKAVRTDLQRMVDQIKQGDTINLGDRGPAVAALQRHLAATGIYTGPVSGTFDAATDFALKAFQKSLGLKQTGELDARGAAQVKKHTLFVKDGFEDRAARLGEAGSDIKKVENKLVKLGFLDGSKADGVYDQATQHAVERYRKADPQLADNAKGIGAGFNKEISKASKGYDHDPYRRREIGSGKKIRQHTRLDELTEKAAKSGDGIGRGDKGRAVLNVEKHLEAAGYELGTPNAKFGGRTEAAVRAFQRKSGLAETGVVDEKTWSKLRGALFAAKSGTSPAMREGEIGGNVKNVEKKLKKLGYNVGKVDGKYTEQTAKAVERFQSKHKLNDTGAVGKGTLNKIGAAYDEKFGGVSLTELRRIMPNLDASRAKRFLPYLNKAMTAAKITTKERQAAFLAQLAEESGELRYMEEIASGAEYEGRTDLGNIYPGDGVRYKGRGPIQLTGRANYRAAGKALGLPLEKNPQMASRPDVAFRIATWFWTSRGLNGLADKRDFREITRRINGGYNGYETRLMYYRRALGVL